jgi:hypothetical protein
METDAARVRRYEKALEMIWNLTRGKSGATSRAERDIAAVALGLRAAGTHLRGIDHLAPPKPAKMG